MMFAGLASTFASTVIRLGPLANFFRFAGPVPMVIGAVVSLYELGGWRMFLALPATVGTIVGMRRYSETVKETHMKDEAASELQASCPTVPVDAVDAMRLAPAREFETNRLRLQVEWPPTSAGGPEWQLNVTATRDSPFQPWHVDSIRASQGIRTPEKGNIPPPQTRQWRADATSSLEWVTVWQRS